MNFTSYTYSNDIASHSLNGALPYLMKADHSFYGSVASLMLIYGYVCTHKMAPDSDDSGVSCGHLAKLLSKANNR